MVYFCTAYLSVIVCVILISISFNGSYFQLNETVVTYIDHFSYQTNIKHINYVKALDMAVQYFNSLGFKLSDDDKIKSMIEKCCV